MKTKYLLHMLLLGRSWGAVAQTIRLLLEHSGARNSDETWSSPRAATTTAVDFCRVPGQALCAAILSGGLSSPQLLWQALPRDIMAFLMQEASQLKEGACRDRTQCLKGQTVAFPCPVSIPPYQAATRHIQAPDLPWAERDIHRQCEVANTHRSLNQAHSF